MFPVLTLQFWCFSEHEKRHNKRIIAFDYEDRGREGLMDSGLASSKPNVYTEHISCTKLEKNEKFS